MSSEDVTYTWKCPCGKGTWSHTIHVRERYFGDEITDRGAQIECEACKKTHVLVYGPTRRYCKDGSCAWFIIPKERVGELDERFTIRGA